MRNFVQDGDVLTLTAPYNRLSGQAALIGTAIFGVAANDVLQAASGEFVTEGVFTLPKTAALEINIGDKVYWDDAAKEVNKTAQGNTYVGVAIAHAANPSATAEIRLNGVA
jgi:predicted RecA/RadA family phage recombinase